MLTITSCHRRELVLLSVASLLLAMAVNAAAQQTIPLAKGTSIVGHAKTTETTIYNITIPSFVFDTVFVHVARITPFRNSSMAGSSFVNFCYLGIASPSPLACSGVDHSVSRLTISTPMSGQHYFFGVTATAEEFDYQITYCSGSDDCHNKLCPYSTTSLPISNCDNHGGCPVNTPGNYHACICDYNRVGSACQMTDVTPLTRGISVLGHVNASQTKVFNTTVTDYYSSALYVHIVRTSPFNSTTSLVNFCYLGTADVQPQCSYITPDEQVFSQSLSFTSRGSSYFFGVTATTEPFDFEITWCYGSSDCRYAVCPGNNCDGRGACSVNTLKCTCDPGRKGDDCTIVAPIGPSFWYIGVIIVVLLVEVPILIALISACVQARSNDGYTAV